MDLVIEGLAAFFTFNIPTFTFQTFILHYKLSGLKPGVEDISVLLRREHGQRAQSHASRLTESRQVIQNISTFNVNVFMNIHSQ